MADIIHNTVCMPKIMGILNVTPDSFSDGGSFDTVENAVAHAIQMAMDGADIIDIGGESNRPGSSLRVSPEEQISRIVPVLENLAGRIDVPISVDTTHSSVVRAAFGAGATIINDISAFEDDPQMAETAAELGCPVIIMHKQGQPSDMQVDPHYENVVDDVLEYLVGRIEYAISCGVKKENIIVDPGIGFGKTLEHNLDLICELDRFCQLGGSVLLGASRKSFIGKILSIDNPVERINGDLAVLAVAVSRGVDIVRVHEVRPVAEFLKMLSALQIRANEIERKNR